MPKFECSTETKVTSKSGVSSQFRFEIEDEDRLTWQQYNAIHAALNLTYIYRTASFLKKAFAQSEPFKRILCYEGNELIGHIAIFENCVALGRRRIIIGGIGMLLSLKPFHSIAYLLRAQALEICRQAGYPFAIGRVKNNERTKKSLQDLVFGFLDIPLIAKTSTSHSWETLAIYNTGGDPKQVKKMMDSFKSQGFVKITGEVF